MTGFITRGFGNSRIIEAGVSVVQLDVTSSTTLTNIAGLAHVLQSGCKYIFEGHITGTAGASGGAKVAIATDGSLTATQFTMTAMNFNGTTLNAQTTVTTLGSAAGGANAIITDVFVYGSIVVNKGGVCRLQLAQNTSNGTATSALVGSYMKFIRAI